MVTMSDTASAQIKEYFDGKEVQPIRIFLSAGGCSGPRLMLALDEVRDDDDTFELDGFSFVVDKELLAEAKPIHIDLTPMGFDLTSSLKLEGGGCGCGSSCGSGGGGAETGGGCGSGCGC